MNEETCKSSADIERLIKAAEKVYQLRSEAAAGERFTEFYTAILRLGHALLKVNYTYEDQLPANMTNEEYSADVEMEDL